MKQSISSKSRSSKNPNSYPRFQICDLKSCQEFDECRKVAESEKFPDTFSGKWRRDLRLGQKILSQEKSKSQPRGWVNSVGAERARTRGARGRDLRWYMLCEFRMEKKLPEVKSKYITFTASEKIARQWWTCILSSPIYCIIKNYVHDMFHSQIEIMEFNCFKFIF